MDIKRLPAGEIAPPASDCIKITMLDDGRFSLATSTLKQCDDEEEFSEAILSSDAYESRDDAEAAGLTWAHERCVATVYIESV